MRFLCLHGIGTNSQVFETQTAALRYELGDQHTYEFVEGTIPWPIAPGLSSLFDPTGSYYSYFDPNSPKSVQDALNMLRSYLSSHGPFDGILGFSQGAGLAAMHIVREGMSPVRQGDPPFKCAIFISSIAVPDPTAFDLRGEIRFLDPEVDKELIQIPTVHIWGAKDELNQGSQVLKKLCVQSMASVFIHDGDHEIPGLGAKEAVVETVKAMRRGISNALYVQ